MQEPITFTIPAIHAELRRPITHCKRGHEFTPENTKTNRNGSRVCITCDKLRKKAWIQKKNTKERQVDVACPVCGRIRSVVWTTAKRLEKMPHICRSCSRKVVRGKMTFEPTACAKCGKMFAGRSGSARFCDECARRAPLNPVCCPVCGKEFVGYKNRKACSQSCKRRLRMNATYFGGRMFEAEGWKDKTCTICNRHVPKRFHIHHVFGHPNHERLVILCAGCHDIVSKLAMRKNFATEQYRRVQYFAAAQRLGREPAADEQPHIDVEIKPA